MRIFSLVLVIILVSGCTSTYQQDILTEASTKLLRDKSIAIAIPKDGRYEEIVYANSAAMTADAIKIAFTPYSHDISILTKCHDIHCLKNQVSPAYDYLVLPEILHWEDRATEWSGKLDRITIKISIFDGNNKFEKASVQIKGTSKSATFGGDHPQDLLQEPLNGYIKSLY